MPVAVAFDVLGTCFSLDEVVKAVAELTASLPGLEKVNARSLVNDWFHSAQRDYTYLSMNDQYTPIFAVLSATLPRALALHFDFTPAIASATNWKAHPGVQEILSALKRLTPQPGLGAALQLLQSHDVNVFFVTNGSTEGTVSYLAEAGLEGMVKDNVISCDDVPRDDVGKGVAKPDKRVYENAWRTMAERSGAQAGQLWFCAAHAWDLLGANRAGFRTALSLHEERVTPSHPNSSGPDLGIEVIGSDLVETVRDVLASVDA